MKKENDIKKELQEIAPFLEQLKEKEEGFLVPENYFKTLPEQVLFQIKRPAPATEPFPDKQTGWLSLFSDNFQFLLRPRVALTFASIATLIIISLVFLLPRQGTDGAYFSNISNSELDNYILSNIDEFDLNTFVEAGWNGLDHFENDAIQEELDDFIDELMDDIEISELEDLL